MMGWGGCHVTDVFNRGCDRCQMGRPYPMVLKRPRGSPRSCHMGWWFGRGLGTSFYAVGARGFTSGLINVWPEHSVAINRALEAGDFDHARRLIETMQVFEDIRAAEHGGANVSGVKCALAMLGNDCGGARPPASLAAVRRSTGVVKQFAVKNGLISWGDHMAIQI